MTNSISACQCWTEPHLLRATMISYLNEDLNIIKKEDITETLKASNANKDNLAVKEVKPITETSFNSFKKNAGLYRLVDICTGNSCKKARKVLKISF